MHGLSLSWRLQDHFGVDWCTLRADFGPFLDLNFFQENDPGSTAPFRTIIKSPEFEEIVM